jgi:cytochrome bd ubiquinol oxidase subunit II
VSPFPVSSLLSPVSFLSNAVATALLLALTAYVLLAGADFGGGVWDWLASGPLREAERERIAHAIGPIWEANHVWLIIVIVVLFTCFPPAFAELAIALHIPLTLLLIGIVLRGSAFAFRSFDTTGNAAQQRWGRVFSVASIVTPILLGVTIGAIASARVHLPAPGASFLEEYVRPWLTPFAFAVGLFALALFAFLAAVYMTVETADDPPLQERFRVHALRAALGVFVMAALTLAAARREAPRLGLGLTTLPAAALLHGATAAAAVTAIAALFARSYRVARLAAAAQIACILWGWAFAQYPYLIPPSLTIEAAAAEPVTLRLTLAALAGGALVLFPSLGYLFRVFKGSAPGGSSSPRDG